MNAAFLLLTSACLGQPPAAAAPPAAAPPAAAVVAAAPCGGCDTGCASSTCGSSCHRASLLDRIRARLHGRQRHGCCDTAPTCNTCHATPAPTCNSCQSAAPRCGSGCGTPLFSGYLFHKNTNNSGGAVGCAGSSDPCPKAGIFDKLKARGGTHGHGHGHGQSSGDSGCGGGCGTPSCGGCGAAPMMVAPTTPAPGGTTPMPMSPGEKKQS